MPQGYPIEGQESWGIYTPISLDQWLRAPGKEVEKGCSFSRNPVLPAPGQGIDQNQQLEVLSWLEWLGLKGPTDGRTEHVRSHS